MSSGVPPGFEPETAAAVGTRALWVGGDYRCAGSWCLALLRSTDGGARFTRVGIPPLPSQGVAPTFEFANARDGFAFAEDATALYATNDGGMSWHRVGPRGTVHALSIDAGSVYAVFGRSRFERAPVPGDDWRPLPFLVRKEFPLSVAARGRDVWLLGHPRHPRPGHLSELQRSADAGRTFTTAGGPCADLGGTLAPAGEGVVWAVCPSGMMAGLLLSTDGGRTFPMTRSFHDPGGIRLPTLTNSSQIYPASARTAVLYEGAAGPLFRTTDLGRRWTRLPRTTGVRDIFWLRFATSRIGTAVFTTRSHPDRASLWRTTDAGATWRTVPVR